MTLIVVRWGLETALVLTVAYLLCWGGWRLSERIGGPQAASVWLGIGYALLVGALLLPAAARLAWPAPHSARAPMEVWMHRAHGGIEASLAVTALAVPGRTGVGPSIGAPAIGVVSVGLLAAAVLGLGHLGWAMVRLRRRCRRLVPFRQVGRVVLCASADVRVPFAAWAGGHGYIVVPLDLVLEPDRLRLAIAHEVHHLRARDTGWAHLAALVRALFPWHPAAHAWVRLVARLQEIACDQRVTARPAVAARQYAECLVWVAERAAGPERALPGALAMLDGSAAFLAQRIERVVSPRRPLRRAPALPAAALALVLLAGVAAGARAAVIDRRVSLAQAQAIAARIERRDGFHIEVDDTVLAELDAILSNPPVLSTFKEGMDRLPPLRAGLEEVLRAHGLPRPLLAIPQVESRFQVVPEGPPPFRSAGIWQFIPQTAREFGLRVDGTVDERLVPAREREAAATYLTALHQRFGDWPLAIAAYNNGVRRVSEAVASSGSRDIGTLVRSGAISHYVSQVLATALLMDAPELLR